MDYIMMMRSFIVKRSDGKEVQRDEVPIIDSNRDLKERFGERFFKPRIFFDKL